MTTKISSSEPITRHDVAGVCGFIVIVLIGWGIFKFGEMVGAITARDNTVIQIGTPFLDNTPFFGKCAWITVRRGDGVTSYQACATKVD